MIKLLSLLTPLLPLLSNTNSLLSITEQITCLQHNIKSQKQIWKHAWQNATYKKITQVFITNDLLLRKYAVFKLNTCAIF
jgi:hypothetical protein